MKIICDKVEFAAVLSGCDEGCCMYCALRPLCESRDELVEMCELGLAEVDDERSLA